MRTSETAVTTLFALGASAGLGSIIYGVVKANAPEKLNANVTCSFLMSISGNCTRILANSNAFIFEKTILSLAVFSYSLALGFDCDETQPTLGLCLKLITAGSVGAWNAAQIVRLHSAIRGFVDCCSQMPRLQLFTRIVDNSETQPLNVSDSINTETKVAITAFCCYSAGASIGYSAFSIGLLTNAPIEKLEPFITFAFIMSHWGNLIRTEFNLAASMFEKNYIRVAVISYCIALCCDFLNTNKSNMIGAYTKLTAAGFVGLWNTVQTWRLNSVLLEVATNEEEQGLELQQQTNYQSAADENNDSCTVSPLHV